MLENIAAEKLQHRIDPATLGFRDTSELVGQRPGWIGQTVAEQAARFGLNVKQRGFHLLVAGESGSGRTSLMLEAMRNAAKALPPSPDLVYLHHFDAPEKALPLYLKPGAGAQLRQALTRLSNEHREIIDLVYYHEKSVEEVAGIVGIPEATVKTRMFYARKKLSELLKEQGIDRGWP